MKVVLRADASSEIGTGHVMRQVALAEELLRRGARVFLVGEVLGPSWLEEKLTSLRGLQRFHQPAGTFDSGVLKELGASVSTIDSYAFGQSDLAEWESQSIRTLVFIDGPWQQLRGGVAVVPTIDDSSLWLEDLRSRFSRVHAGPDYLMIREEIRRAKQQIDRNPATLPQILVVIGGSDPRGYSKLIASALCPLIPDFRIVIAGDDNENQLTVGHALVCDGIVYAPRSDFVNELTKSSLVISAAGTTAAELLFLKVPTLFVPVAENQSENARAIERLRPSCVLRPESPDFGASLRRAVHRVSDRLYSMSAHEPIDDLGSRRIASLLLGDSGV